MSLLNEISRYVLAELAKRNSPKHVAISALLENNPFRDFTSSEQWEVANLLISEKHVDAIRVSAGPMLKLTLKGSDFIGGNLEPYIANDKFDSSEVETVKQELERLFEKLNTLQLGQEIIFDEVANLKKLIHVLNKNDWKTLVKGKLFEMGLGSFTDSFIGVISEHFSDFKLLK